MDNHQITIRLFANMREKAGTGCLQFEIPSSFTVGEMKKRLKFDFPSLGPQLSNVVVLVNKTQILLDEDVIPLNAELTFLPRISGG